ncbi:MAG: acriflavin resistance protein, partial [Halothiobacillaceae bacterium]
QLRAAYDGALVQIFQEGEDEIEVRAILPDSERRALSRLEAFSVVLANGNSVPLKTVATLSARQGFEALRHSDAKLAVRISADVERAHNSSNTILNDLQAGYLPALMARYQIQVSLEGRAAEQAATMADMKRGGLIALALIYIILVASFSSYSRPLVIMMAIPFGFIGAVVGHYLLNIDLTILSMFGVIGLSGIVVNDAIILIATYQELRNGGMPSAAAIPAAATSRLRAVLLTSLTTIAGLAPLLFETSVQAQFLIPMAASIVFGIAFSTVLVLLVIPAILSLTESLSARVKNSNRSAVAATASAIESDP